MAINTLEYAKIFQTELDKKIEEQLTSAWMDANAGQVKYTGGDEVKIPKISSSAWATMTVIKVSSRAL